MVGVVGSVVGDVVAIVLFVCQVDAAVVPWVAVAALRLKADKGRFGGVAGGVLEERAGRV